jgi:hypothetical protein
MGPVATPSSLATSAAIVSGIPFQHRKPIATTRPYQVMVDVHDGRCRTAADSPSHLSIDLFPSSGFKDFTCFAVSPIATPPP